MPEIIDPTYIEGSSKSRRRMRREAMHAVDFDPDPPRCANCSSFQPGREKVPGKKNSPPFCLKNKFFTRAVGICDTWTSPLGVELEKAPDEEEAQDLSGVKDLILSAEKSLLDRDWTLVSLDLREAAERLRGQST